MMGNYGTANTWLGPLRISSRQGYRTAPTAGASSNHHGTDFAIPQGTNLRPNTGGTVTAVKYPTSSALAYVWITDSSGNVHEYLHLSQVDVKVGDVVTTSTIIGKTGGAKGSLGSGPSTGSHLDYRVKDKNGKWLDSLGWATGKYSDSGSYIESLSGGGNGADSADSAIITGSGGNLINSIIKIIAVLLLCIAAVYLFMKSFGFENPYKMIRDTAMKSSAKVKEAANVK